MSALEWSTRPELRNPALVCAFRGWNDAGEAASAAVTFLAESFDATAVGRIDPEEFFDFTAVRPTVRLDESRTREIEWPSFDLHSVGVPGGERDLLLLTGPEPSLRWRAFTGTVIEAARAIGARTIISLGALLADVPHSRAVPITGIASDEAGMTAVSLWASVPHYVAAAPNPKAALALLRRFKGAASVEVDASELEEAADDYERQVTAAVASDPEVKAFV